MRRLLLLPVLALVALFLAATPASAATVTEFTIGGSAGDRTATVGEELSVSVFVEAATDLDSTQVDEIGTAADNPGVSGWGDLIQNTGSGPIDSTVTFLEAGIYTFAYEVSEDGEADAQSQTITVTVVEPTEIPVPEITFPDTCTVVLPETANVTFGVGFGNFGNEIDAGTYDLSEFYNSGFPITIGASPAEGFAFPEDAQTFVELTPSADCFPQLVRVEPVCQAIEFTNTTDDTVVVRFGVVEEEEPDSEFELAAGATRTVGTERETGVFSVNQDPETFEVDQAGPVTIEQDCTPAGADDAAPSDAAFPTVAPAAGVDQASSTSTAGALALVALIGAALVGGRRLLRSA